MSYSCMMEAKHEVWFRDPGLLVPNISRTRFIQCELDISTTVFKTMNADDNHHVSKFHVGNLGMEASRSCLFSLSPKIIISLFNSRTVSPPIPTPGSMFVPIILGSERLHFGASWSHTNTWRFLSLETFMIMYGGPFEWTCSPRLFGNSQSI